MRLLIVCILSIWMSIPAFSADEAKGLARIPAGNYLPGDIIELDLELSLPEEAEPIWPESHPEIKGLKPYDKSLPERKIVAGKQSVWIKTYYYLSEDSLSGIVENITQSYKWNDSTYTLPINKETVSVVRIPADKTWILRAAYEPAAPVMKWTWWPLLILFAIILMGAIIFFWKKYRRKAVTLSMPTDADPVEWSLQHLRSVQSKMPLSGEDLKAGFTTISDVIRIFVERTTDVKAVYMLSNEWLDTFERNEQYSKVAEDISFVINTCDSVKFARFEPDAELQKKTVETAITIIQASCWRKTAEHQKGGENA